MTLTEDVIEVIGSSRLPMPREDIEADLKIWPLHRGEKLRTKIDSEQVAVILSKLIHARKIEVIGGGYRVRHELAKEPSNQLQLF